MRMMLSKAAPPLMMLALIVALAAAAPLGVGASHRDSENSDPQCRCRARLRVQEPQLRYNGAGEFVMTPVVDVSIRTRGDAGAPSWQALLAYSGQSTYQSRDITVPEGTVFAGEQEIWNGSCGTNFDWRGLTLDEVKLAGLHSGLLGTDEDLKGQIETAASLSVCGEVDEDDDRERFTLDGPLTVKS